MAYGSKTSTEDRGEPKSLGNDAKKATSTGRFLLLKYVRGLLVANLVAEDEAEDTGEEDTDGGLKHIQHVDKW